MTCMTACRGVVLVMEFIDDSGVGVIVFYQACFGGGPSV